LNREFRLTPPESGRGLSCDANGAFIGNVPLLRRSWNDHWEPRDGEQLSELIGTRFGLPIDMSSKMGGLNAISRALDEGNLKAYPFFAAHMTFQSIWDAGREGLGSPALPNYFPLILMKLGRRNDVMKYVEQRLRNVRDKKFADDYRAYVAELLKLVPA
jgi:hypothetical protein